MPVVGLGEAELHGDERRVQLRREQRCGVRQRSADDQVGAKALCQVNQFVVTVGGDPRAEGAQNLRAFIQVGRQGYESSLAKQPVVAWAPAGCPDGGYPRVDQERSELGVRARQNLVPGAPQRMGQRHQGQDPTSPALEDE